MNMSWELQLNATAADLLAGAAPADTALLLLLGAELEANTSSCVQQPPPFSA